jgi:hypothetical protein
MNFDSIIEATLNGLSKGKTPQDLANKHEVSLDHINSQLEKGIKVEIEHTMDHSTAKKIAMDHLFEDPDYYTKLKKMENG